MDTSISTKSQHTQVTIFHATKLPGEKSKGLFCEWKRLTFDSSCYSPLTFSIKESLNKSKITIFQCDEKRSLHHYFNYDDFCFYFWVGIPPPPYIYSPWFHSSNQIIHLFYCNQSSAVVPGNSVQTHLRRVGGHGWITRKKVMQSFLRLKSIPICGISRLEHQGAAITPNVMLL